MNDQEMQIVEIHPDCKYVIICEDTLYLEEMEELVKRLGNWWTSDEPFIIAYGCKLVKVKDGQE